MLAVEAATRASVSSSSVGVLLMARCGHGLQAELAPRCAKQEILPALDGEEHEAAGARETQQRGNQQGPSPAEDIVFHQGCHCAGDQRKPACNQQNGRADTKSEHQRESDAGLFSVQYDEVEETV